jgi:hypothetical protein
MIGLLVWIRIVARRFASSKVIPWHEVDTEPEPRAKKNFLVPSFSILKKLP